MDVKKKLSAMRRKMAKENLAAYIQPVHDEFMNETPPSSSRRVDWLCGFSGSAGTAVVGKENAALFVDGRYVLQAKNEVSEDLFAQYNIEDKRPDAWLAEQLKSGQRVGYDPRLTTRDMLKRLETGLGKHKIECVAVPNLVDEIWADRPPLPNSIVTIHERKLCGELSDAKRKRIAENIKTAGADTAILTAPDSVCWLLNIRAADVETSPLLLAPAIIDGAGMVQLFVNANRVSADVVKHLGKEVTLCAPDTLEEYLLTLGKKHAYVLCDQQTLPVWYTQTLEKSGAKIIDGQDPCVLPKAIKNAAEIKGTRQAHLRDGVAVTKLLAWLDKELAKRQVTELEVSDRLLFLRAESRLFVVPSFATIAGSGPHGAIVHYRASKASNRVLGKGELFLLDSGGQYPDGTTDITRTIPIGRPSEDQKDKFTRVLKGHIGLATAQFPEGTTGAQLDALARRYLWEDGADYDHGTGHGVGYFLNVHEGPQRINKRGGDVALRPGMIISNEPGYYKEGAYGVRIENLVAVIEKRQDPKGKKYFGFETLTCAPIDTRAVDMDMLTAPEKSWLNDYHAWVFTQLSPNLAEDEKDWLSKRCAEV